jgi:hypothetical protein
MGAREDLLKLAVEIGPRGAGTPAEREAGEYIKGRFESHGLQVSVDEFSTISTYSYLYMVYLGLAVATAWLSFWLVLVAAPVAVLNAVLFALDLETYPLISRVLPHVRSANVIGETPSEEGVTGLVVVAHYDSSRAALSFHPKLVGGFRNTFSLMIGCIFGVAALSTANFAIRLAMGGINFWVWVATVVASMYLFVPLAIMIHREAAMRHTPGANDNASGVVTMLALMDKMSEPESLVPGVMFVATGAEEVGTAGMIEFLKKRGRSIRDAFIVNLDNLGAGRLYYIDCEGMLVGHRSDEALMWLSGKVVAKKRFPIERRGYRLLSTDATPALARGYRAMSVMAFDEQGMLPNWHWETDTADNVDISNIENARAFLWNLVRRMDLS